VFGYCTDPGGSSGDYDRDRDCNRGAEPRVLYQIMVVETQHCSEPNARSSGSRIQHHKQPQQHQLQQQLCRSAGPYPKARVRLLKRQFSEFQNLDKELRQRHPRACARCKLPSLPHAPFSMPVSVSPGSCNGLSEELLSELNIWITMALSDTEIRSCCAVADFLVP
jgi:hypothetical protein